MHEYFVLKYAFYIGSCLIGYLLPMLIRGVAIKFVRSLIVVFISILIYIAVKNYEQHVGVLSVGPFICFSLCLCLASRKESLGK